MKKPSKETLFKVGEFLLGAAAVGISIGQSFFDKKNTDEKMKEAAKKAVAEALADQTKES